MKRSWILCLVLVWGCGSADPESVKQPTMSELLAPPVMTAVDKPHADIFVPLDGMWEGRVRTYRHVKGQQPGARTLIGPAKLAQAPYELVNTADVRRIAVSDGPIFQRVETTERSPTGTVRASGGQKVLNGKMWRVAKRPDRVVIEWGTKPAANVFQWVEYDDKGTQIARYDEVLTGDTLVIAGWALGPQDDPSKGPGHYLAGELRKRR